jgi:DNA-binding IclR family transcriptional regulator
MQESEGQSGGSRKSLESVDRVVRVLRTVDAEDPITLADVARRCDLSEATALRYLTSLALHGLVERTPSGRYRLGWELFRLGRQVAVSRVPRNVTLPVMEQLREQFNETVNLALREQDEVVIIEVLESKRTLKPVNQVGQHDPWHASALGKAMLATMPQPSRDVLLDRIALTRLTDATIVDRTALERELEITRHRRFAIDRCEVEVDLTCVAAAVLGPNGAPAYAISVSFPTFRVEEAVLQRAGEAAVAAAGELRDRLGYSR